MPLPIAGALMSIISGMTATLASEAARFLALKVFMTTIFVVILPIVLNNFLVEILTAIINKAASITGGMQSHVMQLTGLSAYLADLLQVPLVVSILLGAVSVRFTLKLIRLG